MYINWTMILGAFLISFVITVFLGPLLIPLLNKLKLGQNIRTDGPSRHLKKSGTPTMGGVLFLAAITAVGLLLARQSFEAMLVLGLTLAFGLIGFLDDFIKVYLKRPLGLRAREKLLGQILFSILFIVLVISVQGRGTDVMAPYSGFFVSGGINWELGTWGFPLFSCFLIIGMANSVNLTDGLDGLAAGVTALVSAAYIFIAVYTDRIDLAALMAAVAGGCSGFLIFNRHPARVFMGDTGSLALGAALGAISIVTRSELFLLIIGGIFVLETGSVILQVASFQLLGRRIFRMSPLHHHFELCNWSENKVVYVFWIATILFILIGLGGYYGIVF